jgi:hypothetical protein
MSLRYTSLRAITVAAIIAILFTTTEATAQTAQPSSAQQILDRVYSFNAKSVLNLATGNAASGADYTATDVTGTSLSVCSLTSVSGLFCLDGKTLRKWANPQGSSTSSTVLSCADSALGLDSKSDGCTGMAVDQTGAIWLAGKKKNGHSVIKVQKKVGTCPSGWVALTSGPLCAREYYAGRPVLVDITVIDGSVAKAFGKTGVLGVEERKNAVFFPDSTSGVPQVLVTARDWGLSGNEVLQDVTLLQIPGTSSVTNYVLATTSTGRVLAKDAAATGAARQVFSIPPAVNSGAVRCNADAQYYGLRSSTTDAVVYVSDRNYCRVLALQPPEIVGSTWQLTTVKALSTTLAGIPGQLYPPTGLTVAPGYSFEVADCAISCGVVNDEDGNTATKFLSVELVPGTPTDAVAFQIRGIPDCRYRNAAGFPAELQTVCNTSGIVVNPNAAGTGPDVAGTQVPTCLSACPPAAQWLNVTPLLPDEVVNAYKAGGFGEIMPKLLVSPQFRGQAGNGYVFEALFVLTNPLLHFRDSFEAEYLVDKLHTSNTKLGCYPADTASGASIIRWDVVTTVSEIFPGIGGNNVDMLTNIGCGSARTINVRLSLLPYDLEITPDTWGVNSWSSGAPVSTVGDDAVYARLLQKLYSDLYDVQARYACAQPGPLLGTSLCNTLASTWQNGRTKLDSCVNAAFDPKQSAGDENCQSFVSQLTNYQSRLPPATSSTDLANRTGELKARIQVIFFIYNTFFLPSVPAGGFCREAAALNVPGTRTPCPNPWL